MARYQDDKVALLDVSKDAQYHRVSIDSDEENEHFNANTLSAPRRNFRQKFKRKKSINWNCECICRLFVLYCLLMVAVGFAIHKFPPIHDPPSATSPISGQEEHHHVYSKAAVAAGQEVCSAVGTSILREGGNAVDAAIATLLCEGVVEPEYCGIGGGFFMVIHNKTKNISTMIDAREKAPSHSFKSMYVRTSGSSIGPLHIAVPGELKGYSYAYKKYGGGVSWKRLFSPAIELAKNGFSLGKQLALKLKLHKGDIVKSKHLCEVFCDTSRTDVKQAGQNVTNLNLANTLQAISDEGADVFYKPPMAKTMSREIKEEGGIITEEDFANYNVVERATIKVPLPNSNMILVVPPLPSGGPILGLIMSIMDSYNINQTVFEDDKALYWHRTVESFKHAFGARTHFGDPNFVPGVNTFVKNILSDENIQKIKKLISNNMTYSDPTYYGAFDVGRKSDSSTSQVSVLSPMGDVVSVTSTINEHFGSMYMSPTTGVLFNNEMDDFLTQGPSLSTNASFPNIIEPHKRPQSSMSPCLVVDADTEEVVYIIGAAGGKQIPTAVAISLLELLYFGAYDFDEAIREPRLHNQLFPDILYYEEAFNKAVLKKLKQLGHKIRSQPPKSHVNGIKNHVSHIHAFSDLRNFGAEADGW